MARRLTKAKSPAKTKSAVVKPTPIKVRFGGRNQLGPVHRFTTEPKAKAKMVDELQELMLWCQRHNADGVKAISETLSVIDGLTFHKTPERIECLFDTRYDMSLVIEYWRDE